MPQSLSAVYVHLVFSTKERRPAFRDTGVRTALHEYLGGVSKTLECPPLIVGGVEGHVHLLCRFGRTITQAEWVKELKRVSNGWLKEQGPAYADFEWQGGYADFSVSQSNVEQVKQYIAGQEEHHRKMTFRMKSAPCCGGMKWNSMNAMCGIELPSHPLRLAATPLGLGEFFAHVTQGSSLLATLGWRPQSRWDWADSAPFR